MHLLWDHTNRPTTSQLATPQRDEARVRQITRQTAAGEREHTSPRAPNLRGRGVAAVGKEGGGGRTDRQCALSVSGLVNA